MHRITPQLCGTFQYLRNEEVIDSLIEKDCRPSVKHFDSTNHNKLDLLQRHVPLFISFLQPCPRNTISPIVRAVITEITECMTKPYSVPPPPANYAADKLLSKHEPDKCRKYGCCHPVLTPGIFTITDLYDNACKLHQYCLNQEPAFFSHTQFAVAWPYRLLSRLQP